MNSPSSQVFNINGINYDCTELPLRGQKLLILLAEAQAELVKLETHQELLKIAQQQLIAELKPLLPTASITQEKVGPTILGETSKNIPSTASFKPDDNPAPLPDNVPDQFKKKT